MLRVVSSLFLALVAFAADASAVEIHLSAECECRSPLVRLGDVAEVQDASSERAAKLAALPLFPAPADDSAKTVTVGEISEWLQLHDVDLVACRFTGADRVRIVRGASSTVDDQADAIGRVRSPAVGQTNETPSPTMRGIAQGAATDSTSTSPRVVAAARRLRQGELIGKDDVVLRPLDGADRVAEAVHAVSQVIGKEATRSFAADQAIDAQHLRAPLLVKRREMITVVARAGGVKVRTVARSLDDGAHGDLVHVEAEASRERYVARVVDQGEVEVYARSPRVTSPADPPPSEDHVAEQETQSRGRRSPESLR